MVQLFQYDGFMHDVSGAVIAIRVARISYQHGMIICGF